jgi:predicted nucleic acid-binding protein
MTFTSLPLGAAILVDANTLVYRFSLHARFGPPSVDLLERVERQELIGYTSTHLLAETAHRLMTLEAISLLGWPTLGIGNRLRTNPAEVTKLHAFRQAVEQILRSRLQVLTVAPTMLVDAVVLAQQIGLLTNDALTVAVMRANGLTNLASADSDFDRVPGLTRYAPV